MTDIEFVPYKVLASTIIITAIEDYQNGQKDEVDKFINTEWFVILSDIAGIDPVSAREKLLTGDLVDAKIYRGLLTIIK